MTLTIEDGTGVSGADSFIEIADFDADMVAYFGAAMTGTDPVKEAALRRAWVAMMGLQWLDGVWPLFGGDIPDQVKLAQSIMARSELTTPGSLSPSVTLAGQKVLTEVKGIRWTVLGDVNTVEQSRPVVTMAMDLLRPWLAIDPSRDAPIGLGFRSVG